jgi:hypothetical protein
MEFTAASAVERASELSFRAYVPDGWQQGRGAFGGYVLATLLRAMEAAEPDRKRSVRTLTGDLCGPVLPGTAEIMVRVLRRGSHQTNYAAELRQGPAVLAIASSVFSTARPQPSLASPLVPPAPADWQTAPVMPVGPPLGPAFAQHYEYRGEFGAGGQARAEGFIRERFAPQRVDAPALIARLDAWYPTLFHVESAPRPMATISFTAQILVDPATLPPEVPLRYRAHMAALHEGFSVELRELWHGDRVVALNQQTFVIIK